MQPRLAAILAADIVGYSALVGADQAATLRALKRFRTEILAPGVAAHGGRIVKSMGDGWLVEFASALGAVDCALQVQDRLADQRLIRLRIGVHIGDVVHEDEDVFGDGVNVAARLEQDCPPGEIAISDAVHGALDGTRRVHFRDAGERVLKNIARPVRTWRRPAPGGTPAPAPEAPAERPSIAAPVFDDLSGDPAQDHLGDGIAEETAHALSRCRWLVVVARPAAGAARGAAQDVREIARALGVRYLLDGTLRRAGDRVRITARLVDGRTGARLWSERYDRQAADPLALQDEIAEAIAGAVEPELSAIEGAALAGRAPETLSAWECFQRGLWHLYRFTAEEIGAARALFERAVALDPALAPAYARLAYAHVQLCFYGPEAERGARLDDAIALARRALALDDRDPAARVSLGRALALKGALDEGIAELQTATALDPSFAQAHFALSQALSFADRAGEALVAIEEALRLSPHDPHLWTFLHARALARYIAGNLEGAAADERAALRQPNATHWPAMVLVGILGRAGRREEARQAILDLEARRPGLTTDDVLRDCLVDGRPFNSARFLAQFLGDLRAAGMPSGGA